MVCKNSPYTTDGFQDFPLTLNSVARYNSHPAFKLLIRTKHKTIHKHRQVIHLNDFLHELLSFQKIFEPPTAASPLPLVQLFAYTSVNFGLSAGPFSGHAKAQCSRENSMLDWMLNDRAHLSEMSDCTHLLVRKGYYLGIDTEEWICVKCGKRGETRDWPEHERSGPDRLTDSRHPRS
jgi:hypothetical protein